MDALDRRSFLAAVVAVTGTALTGCSGGTRQTYAPVPETPAVPRVRDRSERPRWPGHQPGRIALGVAAGGDIAGTEAVTGPVSLHRTFHQWHQLEREDRAIRADHAAGRLPWVSFKPASTAPGGWAAVASGEHDKALRERARHYAGQAGPVVVTFQHEPHNDDTGTPAEFAAAWVRVHEVMSDETGLDNVASVPIIGEWTFNPTNEDGDPGAYITGDVLDRCSFLGIDLYQGRSGDGYDERLGRVLGWLDAQGHPELMVGLGETGATEAFGSPSAAEWWSRSWRWAEDHTHRLGAVAYFNSLLNNRSGNNWLLTESQQKLDAFRRSLSSPLSCSPRERWAA